MKLGKLIITKELANTQEKLKALSNFIDTNLIILEKIATADKEGNTYVIMLGICEYFADCNDTIKVIPIYELEFSISPLEKSLVCRVKQ